MHWASLSSNAKDCHPSTPYLPVPQWKVLGRFCSFLILIESAQLISSYLDICTVCLLIETRERMAKRVKTCEWQSCSGVGWNSGPGRRYTPGPPGRWCGLRVMQHRVKPYGSQPHKTFRKPNVGLQFWSTWDHRANVFAPWSRARCLVCFS